MIVCTNPPFSLFTEYVHTLLAHNAKFIIIGNRNALTYCDIFPLVKSNAMWLGYPFAGGNAYFGIPKNADTSIYAKGVYNPETGLVHFRNCVWYTNLDIPKRHEEVILWENYTPEKYPKYDNYNAINVDKVSHIPVDYNGVMGVPITFLDKYNPDQFEIIGQSNKGDTSPETEALRTDPKHKHGGLVNGKEKYMRIFIRRKVA